MIGKNRGGNRMDRVGSGQFDLLKEIGSNRVGSIYILYFFQIFDIFQLNCRSFDIELDRIRIGSDQFNLFKK
jgi:hypothetical protein